MYFSNHAVFSVGPNQSRYKNNDKKNHKNDTTGAKHRLLANIP